MQPLFPRWANRVAGASLLGVAGVGVGAPLALLAVVRSPLVTRQGVPVEQPVDFDHRHHVRDDGVPCLYCHWAAERSRHAGIPDANVCIGCHGQVRRESPILAPIRESAATGEPIAWRRVHRVPDFVFFDHASHLAKGVDCADCHGDVASQPAVARQAPLTMRWCLSCHRDRGAPTDCSTCHR